MASARAIILRTVNNGPFAYEFAVDDTVQKVEHTIATLNAAIDLIKPQVAAMAGTVQRVVITVQTS